MWTAKRVRDELPDVPVKIGRKTHIARVSGRLNQFATVTVSYIRNADNPRQHLRDFGAPWMDWHFAWETLAHALNTGNPLLVS